ncbi:ATP-binding protein [Streptomyces sp. TRM76323]|uniref:ATP-binding protein n=1 Tax=Streptomyces tamarix TaxID=3078565 RepID=A0ABU3QRF2_9ACTN|nr:ATP-binding protein [Streptomyces tamarix]MDT9685039.1 ATP-binding protein [Streptomyces tamarix]
MEVSFPIAPRAIGTPPVPQDAACVGKIRKESRTCLGACGLSHLIEDVCLVVSELVTNALVHSGGTEITLTLELRGDFLKVTVRDGTPTRPAPRAPKMGEESGRGLHLVEAIVHQHEGSWGASDCGAVTWCVLSARDAA